MAATVQVTEEAKAIIADAISFADDGLSARIVQQLDRKTYEAVNKVLEALGGQWNRKAKAHLFSRDPRPQLYGEALDAGRVVKEQVVDVKKALQKFYTPAPLVERLIEEAELLPGMKVLEPSAGQGAIALALRDAGMDPICYEIDADDARDLKQKIANTTCADFLTVKPTFEVPRIVMNPPFTKGQDIEHVMHAWQFLEDGGLLVAIMSAGVQYNSTKRFEYFRSRLATHPHSIEKLPPEAFKESGTCVNTIMVSVRK